MGHALDTDTPIAFEKLAVSFDTHLTYVEACVNGEKPRWKQIHLLYRRELDKELVVLRIIDRQD